MNLSVVIPTAGRPNALLRSLKSVIKQDFDPSNFEILVIENGHQTGIENLVSDVKNQYGNRVNLRYIHEQVPGLLAGRHRGASESKNDILVYIDDDIEADPQWLNAIAETFQDNDIKLVGGRNLPEYESPPPAWLDDFWTKIDESGTMCSYLSLSDLGPSVRTINANYVWGLNLSIRKSSLIELEGFHPDGVPSSMLRFRGDGETGLTMKANERGYRAVYQPLARIKHIVPADRLTATYFERRSYAQGISDSYSSIRSKNHFPLNQNIITPNPSKHQSLHKSINLAKLAKSALSKFSSKMNIKLDTPSSISRSDASEFVRDLMSRAHQDGFNFHQEAVESDKSLHEWVIRKNYWNYNIPT